MNQFILLKTLKATSPVTLHDISATCKALSLLEESIPGQGYGGNVCEGGAGSAQTFL